MRTHLVIGAIGGTVTPALCVFAVCHQEIVGGAAARRSRVASGAWESLVV